MKGSIYQTEGRVECVGKTERIAGAKGEFEKRVIVVDDAAADAKRPNPLAFEASGDMAKELDGFRAGDKVTVRAFVNGRKWTDRNGNDRWFTSLRLVEIKKGFASDEEARELDLGVKGGDASGDDGEMPF